MRCLQQGGRARRADRTAAHHGVVEFKRFAGVVLEIGRPGGQRCRFAAIQRGQLAAGRVVPDKKGSSPQTRALRLDQAQHRLDGNHRVGRRTALIKNPGTGLDRHRIRRNHHPVAADDRLAGGFALQSRLRLRHQPGQRLLCPGDLRACGFGRDRIRRLLRQCRKRKRPPSQSAVVHPARVIRSPPVFNLTLAGSVDPRGHCRNRRCARNRSALRCAAADGGGRPVRPAVAARAPCQPGATRRRPPPAQGAGHYRSPARAFSSSGRKREV